MKQKQEQTNEKSLEAKTFPALICSVNENESFYHTNGCSVF